MDRWTETALIFLVALGLSWLGWLVIQRVVLRLISRRSDFWGPLLARTRMAVQLALIIVGLSLAARIAPLTVDQTATLRHVLLLSFIACLTMVARAALQIWVALHLRRFRMDVEDNLLARKHVTQSRILQQVGSMLILAVGISAMLMTIDGVRQYGVSLLASAGAAGLVVGLALQPVLRNLFAGIQLAITQPIRIDDAVIVEGEWGNVEEIGGTYVVIRIWDKRRLIVPLSYFMEQPFQNWTRSDATLIGVVMLYVDYAVSIPDLRAEAERIVRASALWDKDVFALQVTDFRESVTEVRILASARNAGRAFDLRCEIREHLLAYLQREQPGALPRRRLEVETPPNTGPADKTLAEKGILQMPG
ncbi:mechanosensitive ion channel [Paracoccus gahaiensis]|uniref:Mechanosensitive ion channel n=1 Tax=Paracoccus gahaiensis TaxID=1706839 RepID=A0A4U0R5S5_9RHOB|nr:mechanosensitive ion channel domain-containing protein [Paracoccus gahaiensis]TJZ90321.1 mechanosensitive ion channel [Paracoccus gahaiensis]